jgi:hypothetical protein
MKKLLLAIFSILFLFQSVYAYIPNVKDTLIVKQLSSAIEKLISQKGTKFRDLYIDKLEIIKNKYSHQERILYIIESTIKKLSPVDNCITE